LIVCFLFGKPFTIHNHATTCARARVYVYLYSVCWIFFFVNLLFLKKKQKPILFLVYFLCYISAIAWLFFCVLWYAWIYYNFIVFFFTFYVNYFSHWIFEFEYLFISVECWMSCLKYILFYVNYYTLIHIKWNFILWKCCILLQYINILYIIIINIDFEY